MGYPDHSRLVTVATELGMQRQLIVWDDASRVSDWDVSGTGVDPVIATSTDYSFLGTKSIKLSTRSTSPASNDNAHGKMRFPMPFGERVFFGVRIFVPDVSTIKWAGFTVNVFDGSDKWGFQLYHQFSTNSFFYTSAGGGAVEISEFARVAVDRTWHYLGAELDVNRMEWVNVFGNGGTKSLAGVGAQDTGNSSDKCLEVDLGMINQGAQQSHVYFDTVSVTECECI